MRGRKFEIPDNLEVTNGQKVIKLCFARTALHRSCLNKKYANYSRMMWVLVQVKASSVNNQILGGISKLTQNWPPDGFVPEINRICWSEESRDDSFEEEDFLDIGIKIYSQKLIILLMDHQGWLIIDPFFQGDSCKGGKCPKRSCEDMIGKGDDWLIVEFWCSV